MIELFSTTSPIIIKLTVETLNHTCPKENLLPTYTNIYYIYIIQAGNHYYTDKTLEIYLKILEIYEIHKLEIYGLFGIRMYFNALPRGQF